MKRVIELISFLLLVNTGYAQQILRTVEVPRGSRNQTTEVVDGVATHNYSTISNIPVNGNPYMKEAFDVGVLELYDGKRSGDVLLRYNISMDLFEILRNSDTLTLNRPFAVQYIYYDDKVFIFDPKLREDVQRKFNGYFELRIKGGKLSLYIKRRKELSFDSFAANYKGGSGTKEYYYINKTTYIGKNSAGKTFLITSPKSLLKNLSDYKAEVKTFIKQNKLKLKSENDLAKVIEYYNSL